MMAHDGCDLGVVVNLRENPLADLRVPFHDTALFEGEGTRLFEQSWWKADLADVVNQSSQVGQLLLVL